MSTRKSMTLPIIITFAAILVIVFLFMNMNQSQVVCEMTSTFEGDIRLTEEVETMIDGKKIAEMNIIKTIYLPEKYRSEKYFNRIEYALENTLEYLGEKKKYTIGEDRIIVKINVKKNETILLKNISFQTVNDLEVTINSNTKSSDVITLTVGDSYSDGEFMTRLKSNGYTCK